MDFHWIWKAILIVFVGTLLLRLAGRKSISQMTVAQTVIMISIGTLMIQPVSEKSIWITFCIAGILILTLLIIEFSQIKINALEKFFSGQAVVIIENGQLHQKNLQKIRLTVDKLEMRLRQKDVQRIGDVQLATLEPNGEIGILLKPEAQYATKADLQMIMDLIETKIPTPSSSDKIVQPNHEEAIFSEVKSKEKNNNTPEKLE
ncbi:DUF421 domain-containing protein [Texcoconibacillus texcoconensis]|uniref:Uncharacterized membrane protein YcaP (DUF421 family) n=1 Tax=Texcoconibacillus texcoconensis TaxID=1095777 RepID=A0A840QSF9_9BACI|nr:DUF421 domain-containing protein [Texcoconibacillus texcoconensis]MBB5174280.1 uncharacterized membrane protein YcaP (DUF421 family) [Texcoconibacillus texcoconensis]